MFVKKMIFGLACCALLPFSASAQSVVKERKEKTEADLNSFDFKFDNFYVDGAYNLTLGHDDNITSSTTSAARLEGFYTINALDFRLYSPVSESFTIDTGLKIGYKNWLKGEGNDGLVIDLARGDTLAFDWRINERTTLSLVDRLQFNVQDTADARDNQGTDELRFIKNDLGLQFFQQLSEDSSYGLKAGHYLVRSTNNKFTTRERDDYYAGAEFNQKAGAKLTISPYVVYRDYNWREAGNNDVREWQAGAKLTYNFSETIMTQLSLGWQRMQFDGALESDGDEDFQGSLLVNHTISETMSQMFMAKRGMRVSQSVATNYTKDWLLYYAYNWQINSKLSIAPSVSWFISEDQISAGERYNVISPAIKLTYAVSEKLSMDLNYNYNEKRSSKQSEYDQTKVFFSLTYDF